MEWKFVEKLPDFFNLKEAGADHYSLAVIKQRATISETLERLHTALEEHFHCDTHDCEDNRISYIKYSREEAENALLNAHHGRTQELLLSIEDTHGIVIIIEPTFIY